MGRQDSEVEFGYALVPTVRVAVQTPTYAIPAIISAVRKVDPLRYGDYYGVTFATEGRQMFTTTKDSFWHLSVAVEHTSDEIIFFVFPENLHNVLKAIQRAHPYEEPVCHVLHVHHPETLW